MRTEAGALALVVGPSGAGKDSILRGARVALAGDPGIVFVRRYVTRPPGPDEDNHEISVEAFACVRTLGGFLMAWEAHGLSYGVPSAHAIDLACGRHVVVNASRAAVSRARALYPHVRVVLITASPDVLRARLAARGRDEDPAARLARASLDAGDLAPDLTLMNDGALADAIARFVAFVRGPPT